MKNQQIFDKVLTHLRKQGHAATKRSPHGQQCAYRGDNGDMCAVGCLITDEAYDPNMEGATVDAIINELDINGFLDEPNTARVHALRLALKKSGIKSHNHRLLGGLQYAHDRALNSRDMAQFEHDMKRVADRFHLKYTPPKSIKEAQ